jgi:D-mannonate dehydratase
LLAQPQRSVDPTGVTHRQPGAALNEALHAIHQRLQRLAASGRVVCKVFSPRGDLPRIDLSPRLAIPSTEVEFEQIGIDAMDKAERAQPAPNIATTP